MLRRAGQAAIHLRSDIAPALCPALAPVPALQAAVAVIAYSTVYSL